MANEDSFDGEEITFVEDSIANHLPQELGTIIINIKKYRRKKCLMNL